MALMSENEMTDQEIMDEFIETTHYQENGQDYEIEASDENQIANAKTDPTLYDIDEVMKGIQVEREHNDLTGGDPVKMAEIVRAHLDEDSRYYSKLLFVMPEDDDQTTQLFENIDQ